MNPHQLEKLGLNRVFHNHAIRGIQSAHKANEFTGKVSVKNRISQVLSDPNLFLGCPHFGDLAKALQEAKEFVAPEPVGYKTWGNNIDDACHAQMQKACTIPVVRGAALMPDAHVGYSIPIGGVVACENAVMPYAVGVDIACRMKLSVFDLSPELLDKQHNRFAEALQKGTVFGVGGEQDRRHEHPVMDQDWNITAITRKMKERAWTQLGTSGSGNHFVEFGSLTIGENNELGIPAGSYIAVLSHSGSRGAGAQVCNTYSAIAKASLKPQHACYDFLAWLDLDTEAGQEYWGAMNLMGDYAAANHDVIHRRIAGILREKAIAVVENHHNFAWKEIHDGKELIVHRKGATPAGEGVLGVIPGSMATPAFVVKGKGDATSLKSASHGAGRVMSRTQAREKFTWNAVKQDLAKKGVTVLSAGADEVPYAYKDIMTVMQEQSDLVDIVARFDPRIVKMSDDGKSED